MSNDTAWLLLTASIGALLAVAVHLAHTARIRSRPHLANRLIIGTLAVLLAGCAYGARAEQVGDINCKAADGEYTYGSFGWSTVPPGPTCTFTRAAHGFDEVRGPSPVMSVWLTLVAAGAAGSAVLVLRERNSA